jgi:hypothetical protein
MSIERYRALFVIASAILMLGFIAVPAVLMLILN